jgi:hypothetical protein
MSDTVSTKYQRSDEKIWFKKENHSYMCFHWCKYYFSSFNLNKWFLHLFSFFSLWFHHLRVMLRWLSFWDGIIMFFYLGTSLFSSNWQISRLNVYSINDFDVVNVAGSRNGFFEYFNFVISVNFVTFVGIFLFHNIYMIAVSLFANLWFSIFSNLNYIVQYSTNLKYFSKAFEFFDSTT